MGVPLNHSDLIGKLLQKTSVDSAAWRLDGWVVEGQTRLITFLNAHGVNNAVRNPDFGRIVMGSDALLRDGIGVKLALKLFGLDAAENLNGTDLIPRILQTYPTRRIAIFGASLEALAITQEKLKSAGIENVIALEHGFHDLAYYCDRAKSIGADIIILCMGMPKQEILAEQLKAQNSARLIICGGGWADFYSGIKKRAPLWVRKLSLEWVYRLLSEPKRLGKRYTIDIFSYFYSILRARFLG